MSSTTTEVLGIVRVEDQQIGDGNVGPVTRRLHEEFLERRGVQSQTPRLASKKAC